MIEELQLPRRTQLIQPLQHFIELHRVGFAHRLEDDGFEQHLLVQRIAEHPPRRSEVFQQLLRDRRDDLRGQSAILRKVFGAFVHQFRRIVEDAAQLHRPERGQKIVEERLQIFPLALERRDDLHRLARTVAEHRSEQFQQVGAVGETEERQHLFSGYLPRCSARKERDHLIQQGLGVAHPSLGGAGDGVDGVVGYGDFFRIGDEAQPLRDQAGRYRQQIEALTAGDDRRQHLVHFGGREDELHMRRRFLDRFEQHVPRRFGEHVDFVDDVYLVAPGNGRGQHVLREFPHVAGGVAAGGVHLQHVETAFGGDGATAFALAAGVAVLRGAAVQRLGEDAREGGLADAPRSHEQIGVGGASVADRVAQGADHMLLPHHVGEVPRPPLAGDHLIFAAHRAASRAACWAAKIRSSPCSARSRSSLRRVRSKGAPSAVPCISMSFPDSVITTFISTSARESSS